MSEHPEGLGDVPKRIIREEGVASAPDSRLVEREDAALLPWLSVPEGPG